MKSLITIAAASLLAIGLAAPAAAQALPDLAGRSIKAVTSRTFSSLSKQIPISPPVCHLTTAAQPSVPQSSSTVVPTATAVAHLSLAPPVDKSRR